MSVTLTLGDLANEVRVSPTADPADIPTGYKVILTRDLAVATEMVEARAPLAPTESQNKAVVQLVGYCVKGGEIMYHLGGRALRCGV